MNFSPPPGKHLDAVVLERIVRSGNHDARLVAGRPREIGDGRRRHDAGARHAARLLHPLRARAPFRSRRPTRAYHGRSAAAARAIRLPRGKARTSAAPIRRTVGGSSGYAPAVPRIPSVPKSRGISTERGSLRFDFQFLALLIRTWIVWGSIRVTPASRELSARTVNVYSPAPRPARSTNAVASSGRTRDSSSRLPRSVTSTSVGTAVAVRFGARPRR